MLGDVRIVLYISDDKEAGIMFPDTQGESKLLGLFVSNDPEFCSWCLDLFEYYCFMSKPFDINKMKVIE
jgi:predicted transcriptional regulator